jgi:hypothetical protein
MAVIYVSGDRKLVRCAVDSSTVIAKGNMLRLVTDDVRPLSGMSDAGTKAQNQAAARDVFLGIAQKASANGETTPIMVATGGVFEFDCTSASFEVGDLVGAQGTGSGGAVGVSDTAVEAVTSSSLAVGRVYKRGTSVTRVQVEIFSVVMARPQDDTVTIDTLAEATSGAGVAIDGAKLWDGTLVQAQAAPTAETGASPHTYTAAEVKTGIIVASGQTGAITGNLDTGTNMDTAFAGAVAVDQGIYWSLINGNTSSGAITLTAATGHTLVTGGAGAGGAVVAINTTARLFSRRTAANTWITYRIS